jgi:hypothetical protein
LFLFNELLNMFKNYEQVHVVDINRDNSASVLICLRTGGVGIADKYDRHNRLPDQKPPTTVLYVCGIRSGGYHGRKCSWHVLSHLLGGMTY